MPPRSIADVVRLANLVAGETNPVRDPAAPAEPALPELKELIAQSGEQVGSLVSALRN
jgi:hypothetical protein